MKWLYEDGSRLHTDGDGWVYETRQDIEPLLRDNEAERNMHSDYGPTRWLGQTFHKVASVPNIVIDRFIQERGVEWFKSLGKDANATSRFLNDSDNKPFRTKPGKL